MFCDMCGKELPENAVYCMYCGSAVGKNTQNLDAYDLSQFALPTPPTPTLSSTVREQALNIAAKLDNLEHTVQRVQAGACQTVTAHNQLHERIQQTRKPFEAFREIVTTLQRNPALRGAPTEELILSIQQMLTAMQSQDLASQHMVMASQEIDRVSDRLVQALEAMATWLKTHA